VFQSSALVKIPVVPNSRGALQDICFRGWKPVTPNTLFTLESRTLSNPVITWSFTSFSSVRRSRTSLRLSSTCSSIGLRTKIGVLLDQDGQFLQVVKPTRALTSDPQALTAWEDIIPLARNEWICWIEPAKKAETRSRRIEWGCSSLLRMEDDAPVVGSDAPTADSKMVKRDIATARRSRPTSSLA
jgi:Bacteriocin-protection, YdeI or OmpD-Associated